MFLSLFSSAFYIDLVLCLLLAATALPAIWDTLGIFVPSNTTDGLSRHCVIWVNTVNSSLWRCGEARAHFWKTSTFCAHCTTQIQTSKQVFKLHLVTRFDERLQEVKNSHFIWLPSWACVQTPGGCEGNGGKVECCLLDDCYLASQALNN